MIKRFIKNEMSEREVGSMMKGFFEKKDELDFEHKWRGIIKENIQKEDKSPIFYLHKHVYSIVSAASIFILIGVFSYHFYTKNTYISNNYSISTKGVNENYIKINKLIDKYNLSANPSLSNQENQFSNYYIEKEYSTIVNNIDNDLRENNTISDRILFIGAISAIKKSKYDKAKLYLNKITKDSKYHTDAFDLLDLLKDLK